MVQLQSQPAGAPDQPPVSAGWRAPARPFFFKGEKSVKIGILS